MTSRPGTTSSADPRDILVVEDCDTVRRLVMAMLTAVGFVTVRCCASGAEALRLVADREPDIVVSDLEMEGIDGLELARHLKAAASKPVRFVLFTGYGASAITGHPAADSVDAIVPKPFNVVDLLTAMEFRGEDAPRNEAA